MFIEAKLPKSAAKNQRKLLSLKASNVLGQNLGLPLDSPGNPGCLSTMIKVFHSNLQNTSWITLVKSNYGSLIY